MEESLPNLETLIFTNNSIQELADIETLESVKTLKMLSFLDNPVVAKPNYRLFVIQTFPNLVVLDFKKVKKAERDAAKALFKTKEGKNQLKEIKKRAKTFTPGDPLDAKPGARPVTNASGLTPQQVQNIKASIARASTLEEIERLSQMLRTGHIPEGQSLNNANGASGK